MLRPLTEKWTNRQRRLPHLVAGVTLVAVLTACGGGQQPTAQSAAAPSDAGGTTAQSLSEADWNKVVDAAKNEGALTVYTSSDATEQSFLEFEKLYPEIDVTVEQSGTADLITRLDQEISVKATAADVAFHAQPKWFEQRGTEGALAPLQVSPEVEGTKGLEIGRYYTPINRNPYTIAYNKEIAQPVTSIKEFLDKVGSTKVGLLDAAAAPVTAYQYSQWQDAVGDDFLTKLAGMGATVYPGGAPLTQSLASGEIGYALAVPPGYIDDLKAQGAPVEEVVPPEAPVGAQYGPGILATAGHPNAAQVFVNWLLSTQGQEMLIKAQGGAVPSEVEGSLAWDSVAVTPWGAEEQKEFIQTEWNPALRP